MTKELELLVKLPISWADFWQGKGAFDISHDHDAYEVAVQWAMANIAALKQSTAGERVDLDIPHCNAPIDHVERRDAEQAYTLTAFNYEDAPVGSRDWTLYWLGWWHRSQIDSQKSGEGDKPDIKELL